MKAGDAFFSLGKSDFESSPSLIPLSSKKKKKVLELFRC